MKKSKIILFLLFIALYSCNKDEAKLKITDFSETRTITLEPYKNSTYAMMNIWVKGFVNDTILIKLRSKDSEPILKLKGEINERWYTDYYGEGERIVIFEPYKATKGELEIKVKL